MSISLHNELIRDINYINNLLCNSSKYYTFFNTLIFHFISNLDIVPVYDNTVITHELYIAVKNILPIYYNLNKNNTLFILNYIQKYIKFILNEKMIPQDEKTFDYLNNILKSRNSFDTLFNAYIRYKQTNKDGYIDIVNEELERQQKKLWKRKIPAKLPIKFQMNIIVIDNIKDIDKFLINKNVIDLFIVITDIEDMYKFIKLMIEHPSNISTPVFTYNKQYITIHSLNKLRLMTTFDIDCVFTQLADELDENKYNFLLQIKNKEDIINIYNVNRDLVEILLILNTMYYKSINNLNIEYEISKDISLIREFINAIKQNYLKSINTFLFEHIRPIVYQILNYSIDLDRFTRLLIYYINDDNLKTCIIETINKMGLAGFTNINPIPYEFIAMAIRNYLTELFGKRLDEIDSNLQKIEIKDYLTTLVNERLLQNT
jgi:hypothetical protein